MNKKVIIIGSGIGGLGTAGLFAKKGYEVTVFEKNANLGGRA
ncbi:MAG TPA: FAD-dependent oxidoreductase, partial [Pyrinomonadaceae bacterium]|nr:FAD-dependent oxidoreductase [Pyrinomonadaceae bacterium]